MGCQPGRRARAPTRRCAHVGDPNELLEATARTEARPHTGDNPATAFAIGADEERFAADAADSLVRLRGPLGLGKTPDSLRCQKSVECSNLPAAGFENRSAGYWPSTASERSGAYTRRQQRGCRIRPCNRSGRGSRRASTSRSRRIRRSLGTIPLRSHRLRDHPSYQPNRRSRSARTARSPTYCPAHCLFGLRWVL